MRDKREENLIPMSKQPPEVRKKLGSKGGFRSGKVRRERRAMADILCMMMNKPISKSHAAAKEALAKIGISSKDATNGALVNLQLVNLALSSQVDARTKLRAIEMIHQFIDGRKLDITSQGKEIQKDPLIVQVIDSREQVDNEDEDTDNEDIS